MKKSNMLAAYFFVIAGAFFASFFASNAWGWNDEITHKDLSEYAAYQSILAGSKGSYLRFLGFKNGLDEELPWSGQVCDDKLRRTECFVKDWIRYGAEKEDAEKSSTTPWLGRFQNHFHNPLNDQGLTDLQKDAGESALVWAQDSFAQKEAPEGDQSWARLRNLYLQALIEMNETARKENFAKLFKGLGHQMHLLQDMAVPAHARNDAHPQDAMQGSEHWYTRMWVPTAPLYFENWAKKREKFIIELAAKTQRTDFPSLAYDIPTIYFYPNNHAAAPVLLLWDSDVYDGTNPSASLTQGLAEYTNANFFSDDTIFTESLKPEHPHFFPYPRRTSTDLPDYMARNLLPEEITSEDLKQDFRLYLHKQEDGVTIDHFVAVGYFSRYVEPDNQDVYRKTFFLDERCHEDYATHLVPRAVSYSAALLDYFFRGTLEISPPDDFVYGIVDGSDVDLSYSVDDRELFAQSFKAVKARLRNTTVDEEMLDGSLVAVARYKRLRAYDPFLSNGPILFTSREELYQYSVSDPVTIDSLSSTTSEEFTFDFSAGPIPAGVTDLSLQVVFLGTLGAEMDLAVAVGAKDLYEPTHFTFWNSTDETPSEDGQALEPTPGGGFGRDFIVAFSGENPDPDGDHRTSESFYDIYTPLVVIDNLPPAGHARIIVLFDRDEEIYLAMDTGRQRCLVPWKFGKMTAADYQEDENGIFSPTHQLLPAEGHRGVYQHHVFWEAMCNDQAPSCPYLPNLRSVPDDRTPAALDGKINFPNQVSSYFPPQCAP